MTVIDQTSQESESPVVNRDWVVAACLLVGGLVAWIISLFTINIADVNALGFAGAFTPVTWISLLLISAGAVLTVLRVSLEGSWFWRLIVTALVLLIAVIHGTPMILESGPRFFEAYQHVGFIDYIYRTGQHSSKVNNRLSWFGAFGLGSTLSGTAGPPSLFGAIRVFPWAFAMLILFPVYSIVSKFVADQRARAAALIFFVIGNWIAQDYLSPQAVAYFIAMTLVAVILHLAPGGGPSVRQLRKWWSVRQSSPALAIICTVLVTAIVLAHQLSPVMVLAMVLVLVLTGSTTLRVFPVVVFAAFATWLSVGGYCYWGGHISLLLGVHQQSGQSLGLSSIIAQNLTDRLQHGGLDLMVALSRVGLSMVFLAMAALSVWLGRRTREIQILGLLSFIPFVFLGATGYGGEALLRAFFFALPFVSALAAVLVLRIRPRVVSVVLLSLALALLGAMTEISRYGNEKFERIGADQLAIMQRLYQSIPPKTTILTFGSSMPINFARVGDDKSFFMNFFTFTKAGPQGPDANQEIINQIQGVRPDIVVWTPEAAEFATHSFNFKPGWDKKVLNYLINDAGGHVVVDRPDIKIISFDRAWQPVPGVFAIHGH